MHWEQSVCVLYREVIPLLRSNVLVLYVWDLKEYVFYSECPLLEVILVHFMKYK